MPIINIIYLFNFNIFDISQHILLSKHINQPVIIKRYPKILLICFLTLTVSNSNIFAQCPGVGNNACTSNAPTVISSSVSCTPPADQGGRRNFLINNMVAGCTYRIDNCGSGFDTQMTIRNSSGTAVDYNDDNGPACAGSAASIDFICPASGSYRIHLNRYNCATTNNLNGDITVTLQSCITPPSNDDCVNATSLPCGTTNLSGTTIDASNAAHGTGCSMSDYGVWYTFTGDGQTTTISCDADPGYNHEMAIVSGSCGSFTNIDCLDDNGSGATETYTFGTVNSEVYYVYIAHRGPSNTSTSSFTIDRTCVPASCSDGLLNQDEIGVDCGGVCTACNPQDCIGGTSICGDVSFGGNSNGSGNITDLNSSNEDCLNGENESSWYFFEAQSNGTLEFLISPDNGTDDYDFALWGPYPSGSTPGSVCPPSGSPVRCSYAAGAPTAYGGTGLQIGAGDTSEDSGGDDIVDELNMLMGEVYILLIDNYAATTSPFQMNITLSNNLSLDCTPLPIDLLSFSGLPMEGYNQLNWTTVTETNNDYFEIEKSIDGVLFSTIGNVNGSGNSYNLNTYGFADSKPHYGVSYYRLRQVDYNGEYSYSNVVAIKQSKGAEVAIIPNPTVGKVNLNFVSKEANNYKIIVSNVSKIIHSESLFVDKGNHVVRLHYFATLAAGIYFVKIIDDQGNLIKIEKVVKQ